MKNKKPIVSIIIPCLNEKGVVNILLDQLLTQKDDRIEIIAVDNSSDDGTDKLLKSYEKYGVKVVLKVPRGVSKARNAGAKIASGKWLLFLDADTTLQPEFINILMDEINSTNITQLSLPYASASHKLLFKFIVWFVKHYERVNFKLRKAANMVGSALLVHASSHEAINGFNEKINSGEDMDYSHRMFDKFKLAKYLKQPYVYFSPRRFENGGLKKVAWQYLKSEVIRWFGKKPKDYEGYDFNNHKMR